MDKNTIIGFVLIALILFGFQYFNQPSEEEIAATRQQQEQMLKQQAEKDSLESAVKQQSALLTDSVKAAAEADSALNARLGEFAPASTGNDNAFTLENDKIMLCIRSKGGQIVSARLKEFTTNSGDSLLLFNATKDGSSYSFRFITNSDRIIDTRELYFQQVGSTERKGDKTTLTIRVTTTTDAWIDYVYSLRDGDYMVGYEVRPHNLQKVVRTNQPSIQMLWTSKIRQQERSKKFENRYAQLFYKPEGDDPESLSATSDDDEEINTNVKWVAFKDQFFSSVLIADKPFSSVRVESKMIDNDPVYLKTYKADVDVPFDVTGKELTSFRFYFGPNDFSLLKSYDKDAEDEKDELQLDELVYLGWAIFGWINEYVVIPIFNFLGRYINSMGIIILLLTVFIKLIIFPLTYKSYLSTAKMRVLKPEIEAINKKHEGSNKMQERQQATMMLYREAGVNPMGGCLPMLLQMPVLFAMFMFFPAAIELRQQSFLWAEDLSSYDAIVEWNAQIPFISEYFGNHLSLFCLLMTVTNLIYTHINMKNTDTGQNQMPGMKYMMYFMPIMFLFIFNDYASGLSYYYFLSTLITIAQTMLFRVFINEDKLRAQIQENRKNPKKMKKSKFMQRLEDMQKQQQAYQRQQAKERSKQNR
ncbi:MAG: membrane protein insertase YidC [Paludibacteraceae bacterium]|nr:membrane protein insertase YidC [Paludibacteraceae bacterium]